MTSKEKTTTAVVNTEAKVVVLKDDQMFYRSLTIRERLRHRVKKHPLLQAIVDTNGKIEGITCDCYTNCCHPIGKNGIMDHKKRTIVHHGADSFKQFRKSKKANKKIHSSEKNYTSKVIEEPLNHKHDNKKSKIQKPNIEMV